MQRRVPLASVDCSALDIGPDKKIVGKVYVDLDSQGRRKLRRAIARWANKDEEEVLIIDGRIMDIHVVDSNIIRPT